MDCLVTKLKAAASNTSLEKLGCFYIHVKVTNQTSNTQRSIRVTNGVSFSAETLDGSNKLSANNDFSNPTNKLSLNSGNMVQNVYLLEGEYDVVISAKYTLNTLSLTADGANPGPWTINVGMFSNTNISSLDYGYKNLIGKVSDIINDNITFFNNEAGSLQCNLEDFGKFYKLATLRVWGCSSIKGSIENLCTAMSATLQGRPVGERELVITVDARGSGATYNGVSITTKLAITFSSDGTYTIAETS